MRTFLAVSIMLLLVFVFGCSPDNNPLAPQDETIPVPIQTAEVNFGFQTVISHNNSTNATEITFTPDSAGKDGDGFCVDLPRLVVNAKPYFLPEGQVLSLPDGKYYRLGIYRAYSTDKGMVLGNEDNSSLNINSSSSLTFGNQLGLKVINERSFLVKPVVLEIYRAYLSDKGMVTGNEDNPTLGVNSSSLTPAYQLALNEVDSYSFLVEPRVNMQMNSKIFSVDFYGYIAVPIYCDLIKVSFIGGYRSQVKATNVYLPIGGDATLNENYSILVASGLIIDNLHNRIIKSPGKLVYY